MLCRMHSVWMAEKRRGSCAHLAVLFLTLLVIILIWKPSECPGPPYYSPDPPGYLLVMAGNATTLPPAYSLKSLRPGDSHRLIDISDFHFVINPPICNGTDPFLVILVHSDPRNIDKRTAIRSTWGTQLKVVFLLGIALDVDVITKIADESETYRDIVQGSFIDAYRNMTYKHVMALKWVAYHCPGATYILKTDDDVFINPQALMYYLRNNLSSHGARRLILCKPIPSAVAKRSYRSKWRVSPSEYSGYYYPPYCLGWAVLYSPDVVFDLYKESQDASYFWIDDVFVTGLMAAKANIGRSDFGDLILSPERVAELPNIEPFEDFFLFGPPNLLVEEIYSLWKTVVKWGTFPTS